MSKVPNLPPSLKNVVVQTWCYPRGEARPLFCAAKGMWPWAWQWEGEAREARVPGEPWGSNSAADPTPSPRDRVGLVNSEDALIYHQNDPTERAVQEFMPFLRKEAVAENTKTKEKLYNNNNKRSKAKEMGQKKHNISKEQSMPPQSQWNLCPHLKERI